MLLRQLHESIKVRPWTIPGKDLYDKFIKKGGPNEDLEKRIKYLSMDTATPHWSGRGGEEMIAAFDGEKIVGMAGLQVSPNEEKVFWIKFISVDPKYQGKGIGKKLAEEVFNHARKTKMRLRASSYTEDGKLKLKKTLEDLAKKYSDVGFKDGSDHYKFDDPRKVV